MKRTNAFTLVEIIVVIAIVLVLAAILVPVTNRAVLAAKESKGIEHLRQIHQIHMLYQADHGGGGGYGSPAEMGLPEHPFFPSRGGKDWNAAAPYGMNKAIRIAPCGPGNSAPPGERNEDDRIYSAMHKAELSAYGPIFREKVRIAIHWQCSPARECDRFLHKRASAVLLSGTAVTKVGYLSYCDPSFFADPE